MNISEEIKTFLKNQYSFLTPKDIEAVIRLGAFRTFKVGDFFAKNGQKNKYVFFTLKGLFKIFYLDKEGNEIIIDFCQEKKICGDWYSLLSEQNSKFCIQAIELTQVIQFNIEHIEELALENSNVMRMYNELLKAKLQYSLKYLLGNINEKPETRYLKFLKEQSYLVKRVSQKEIASFLGITPVSLSRIKKRIMQRYS